MVSRISSINSEDDDAAAVAAAGDFSTALRLFQHTFVRTHPKQPGLTGYKRDSFDSWLGGFPGVLGCVVPSGKLT